MDVTYQHSLGLEVCWSLHGNDEVTSQGLGMKLGSREVNRLRHHMASARTQPKDFSTTIHTLGPTRELVWMVGRKVGMNEGADRVDHQSYQRLVLLPYSRFQPKVGSDKRM